MENNEKMSNQNTQTKNNLIIKFEPDKSIMTLDAINIARTINANLSTKIKFYKGSKVALGENSITMLIVFEASETMLNKNALSDIVEVEKDEIYSLTEDAKKILEPFVDVDQKIPLTIETKQNPRKFTPVNNQYQRPRIMINLNPIKVLKNLLTDPAPGYRYNIESIKPGKDKQYGKIIIAMEKIPKKQNRNNNSNR